MSVPFHFHSIERGNSFDHHDQTKSEGENCEGIELQCLTPLKFASFVAHFAKYFPNKVKLVLYSRKSRTYQSSNKKTSQTIVISVSVLVILHPSLFIHFNFKIKSKERKLAN